MPAAAANIAFLDNLYRKGPLAGHGFLCQPPWVSIAECGDYSLSDRPDSPVHVLGWVDAAQVGRFLEQAAPETRFLFVYGAPNLDSAKRWLEQVRGA